MTPPLLAGLGVAVLVGAGIVLRSFGSGYRIGRLLATVRSVPMASALEAARAADGRYLRIDGRIDSETDFEDEHRRPLVLRRYRLEVRDGRDWRTVDDRREVVPFQVRNGLSAIAIDADALDEGLVVIPREAVGTAADARDRLPADVREDAPTRMRIQQVSSVEHAVVLGVPVERPDGRIEMTAGAGRPLILSTLEPDEAIRMLAGGRRTRPILATVLLIVGTAFIAIAIGWALVEALLLGAVQTAAAASPAPSAAIGGDMRSAGDGPGLVGAPFLAIGGVVVLGLAAAGATLLYVRVTTDRRRPVDRPDDSASNRP